MIVVAGGTGRLGTDVVRRLAARGLPVQVLTRAPARARHLTDVATAVVACDVRDRAATFDAVRGASTVVSAIQGFAGPGRVSPASVDRDGNANLVDAATATGADVVLVSVVGASPQHPMELFRAKAAAEEHLRTSGTSWTIVRATAFVELWAELLAGPVVFGRGENPINFVAVQDVAAAVERAVLDTRWRSHVIEIGGPQDLTLNQLARLVQRLRGRRTRLRHVPLWLLRALGTFNRQTRAAVAMDTIDMTFNAEPARRSLGDLPMTDAATALRQTTTGARAPEAPAPTP